MSRLDSIKRRPQRGRSERRRLRRTAMFEQLERRDLLTALILNRACIGGFGCGEAALGVLGELVADRGGGDRLGLITANGEAVPLDEHGQDIPDDGLSPVKASSITSITVNAGGNTDLRGVTKAAFPNVSSVTISGLSGVFGADIYGSAYDDVVTVMPTTQVTFHWQGGAGNDTFIEDGTVTLTTNDGAFSLKGSTNSFFDHRFSSVTAGDLSYGRDQNTNRVVYSGVTSINDQVSAGFRGIMLTNQDDSATLDVDGATSQLTGSLPLTFSTPNQELTLRGREGNDTLIVNILEGAPLGTVIVRGDEQDDHIDASMSEYNLTLMGDDGDDTLIAGTGNDVLDGGLNADIFQFNAGWGQDDVLGDNEDTIDMSRVAVELDVAIGHSDNPAITVNDNQGNDLLNEGGNVGILIGGSSDDRFSVRENMGLASGDGLVDGGGGQDQLNFGEWIEAVYVRLGAGQVSRPTVSGESRLFGVTGIEDIITGRGNDELEGDSSDNMLKGGRGDDLYFINEGWGSDEVADDEGEDEIKFRTNAAVTFSLDMKNGGAESEEDPLHLFASDGNNSLFASPQEIEAVFAGNGNDRFVFSGGASVIQELDGGPGDDTLDYTAYLEQVEVELFELNGDVGGESFWREQGPVCRPGSSWKWKALSEGRDQPTV